MVVVTSFSGGRDVPECSEAGDGGELGHRPANGASGFVGIGAGMPDGEEAIAEVEVLPKSALSHVPFVCGRWPSRSSRIK